MSLKFGRQVRLRARHEFDHVQRGGPRVSTRLLTLVGRPNTLDRDRLGIVASRRVGGAVIRNRAKRRLRELFRRLQPATARARGDRPMDVVAIARLELTTVPFAVLEADFGTALRKLRAIKADPCK